VANLQIFTRADVLKLAPSSTIISEYAALQQQGVCTWNEIYPSIIVQLEAQNVGLAAIIKGNEAELQRLRAKVGATA
jgi:hypothetical protein